MANPIRIAMWSGPRNISTAMMRSFENRSDTVVEDEPFYAHYLLKTGTDHPFREETIASQENDWDRIAHRLTAEIPNGKNIWYQKHMTQHNLPGCDLEWTQEMTNCFLIRNPREVILSYSRKFDITSPLQLGFVQQLELFKKIKEDSKQLPAVVDAQDILTNPRSTLIALCDNLNIPFMEEMLSWSPGPRASDGVWGKHWYNNVEASTHFQSWQENETELPSTYSDIFRECNEIYQYLYKFSIK